MYGIDRKYITRLKELMYLFLRYCKIQIISIWKKRNNARSSVVEDLVINLHTIFLNIFSKKRKRQ
jgi:hypothetical protein